MKKTFLGIKWLANVLIGLSPFGINLFKETAPAGIKPTKAGAITLFVLFISIFTMLLRIF